MTAKNQHINNSSIIQFKITAVEEYPEVYTLIRDLTMETHFVRNILPCQQMILLQK